MSRDDAIELFGGTVDAKHLVLSNAADDGVRLDVRLQRPGAVRRRHAAGRRRGQRHRGGQQRVQQQRAAAIEPAALQLHALRRSGPQRGRRERPRRHLPSRHRVHVPELSRHRLQDERAADRDDQHRDDGADRQRHVADGRRRDLEHPTPDPCQHARHTSTAAAFRTFD